MNPLQRPPWIPPVGGASARPRFTWDEWRIESTYQPGDAALQERMAPLTFRANMAMCTAIAEWIVWRFEALSGDFRPLLMLEAAWAAGVHTAYARYHEFDDDNWRGVVRGPIRMALGIVIDLVWGMKTVEPGRNVAWASQLAELVLPDPSAFRAWRELCVSRLEARFPASDGEAVFEDEIDIGAWVPRELFDPGRSVEADDVRPLIEQFVASLDPGRNPYLHTPAEMKEFADYAGSPYRIGADDH
ncbi:hypothetical protein [Rhizobacter sp. P5_C2]